MSGHQILQAMPMQESSSQQNVFSVMAGHIKRSVTLKIITVGILIVLLLIPAVMIQDLIRERQFRRNAVVQEISQKWGDTQTITGPYISVPFKRYFQDKDGKTLYNLNYLHILPESLDITGEIMPEVRYRGLFEAVIYNARLRFSGNFKIPPAGQLNIDAGNIMWDKALLSLGIADMRGIQDEVVFAFNDSTWRGSPGLKTNDLAAAGVSTPVQTLTPDQAYGFSFELNLNGSQQISFIPVGETNSVQMQSGWPSPSFNGAYLPAVRAVGEDGFTASWKVLHLNRNYPQFWEGAQYKVAPSAFGLQLILTADIYQKSMRLAKYAILFLAFTFAACFFAEIINRQRIHPIQYILIGMAILIFYTLVLSLSEHMHFNYAYMLSAASVTLIISGYARAIIADARFALTIFGLLGILYGYLFIVLQLEDYALLMGSVGLLIILAAVMYLTRRINWYAIEAAHNGDDG
jgi:inner membrane protein